MTLQGQYNKIIADIIAVAKEDEHIDAIYLFGSLARGDARALSDIDLAIVSQAPRKVDRGKLNYTAESHNIDCDFTYTTKEALISADSRFNVNYWIREEGILLWKR